MRARAQKFAMMLTELRVRQAEVQFTELLARIAECNYAYQKGDDDASVALTVSCGLAEFTMDDTPEDLIGRADEALYAAKRAGRNRVVFVKKQKSFWKTLRPFKTLCAPGAELTRPRRAAPP